MVDAAYAPSAEGLPAEIQDSLYWTSSSRTVLSALSGRASASRDEWCPRTIVGIACIER
jgi:hypothetical protein